jgi:hypothetical protein
LGSWNVFGCDYNSSTIRRIADALVATGMRDVGYRTLIIQECITLAGHRDASGVPQPDPNKFPEGIPALVQYIHSRGLYVRARPWQADSGQAWARSRLGSAPAGGHLHGRGALDLRGVRRQLWARGHRRGDLRCVGHVRWRRRLLLLLLALSPGRVAWPCRLPGP